MKKIKNLLFVLLVATICCLSAMLVACSTRSDPSTHTHTYSTQWAYDENYHWHNATCGHTAEINGRATHIYNGDVCSVCNYKKADRKIRITLITRKRYSKLLVLI